MPTAVTFEMKGVALTGRPVENFVGKLQFNVEEGGIDMSRFKTPQGIPVLANHDATVPLGKLSAYSFEGKHRRKRNRSLEVTLQLQESSRNKAILEDIESGLMLGLSPTIANLDLELVEKGENWWDSLYLASGEFVEASVTPIPANMEAGMVQMEAGGTVLQVDAPRVDTVKLHADMKRLHAAAEEAEMPNENGTVELEANAATAQSPPQDGKSDVLLEAVASLAASVAQMRAAESVTTLQAEPQVEPQAEPKVTAAEADEVRKGKIAQLAVEHNDADGGNRAIKDGTPYEEYMEHVKSLTMGPGAHTRAKREQLEVTGPRAGKNLGAYQGFMMDPHSQHLQRAYAMEYENFRERCQHAPDPSLPRQSSQSIFIPDDVMGPMKPPRSASMETFRYGGSGSTPIIDETIMREQAQYLLIDRAPITERMSILEGIVGRPTIPIVDSGGNINYYAEPGAPLAPTAENHPFPPPESQIVAPRLSEKQFVPHMMVAKVRISRQSSIETMGFADAIVRQTLADQFSEIVRQDALFGDGSGERVTGVNSQTGITTATAAADLAALTFESVVALRNDIVNAKIPLGGMPGAAYIVPPKVYSNLVTKARSGGGDGFVNQNGTLNGLGIPIIETTLDATTSLNQRFIFLANWEYTWAGFWSGVEMVMDEISDISVRLFQYVRYWDVLVTRPKSIVKQLITAD